MNLVTRCPKCQSDFLASLEQLRMHEGLVRCGTCATIFDANAHLESELPTLTRRAQESLGQSAAPQISEPRFSTLHAVNTEPESYEPEPEPAVLRHRADIIQERTSITASQRTDPVLTVPGESRRPARQEAGRFGQKEPDFLIQAEGTGLLSRIFWGALSLLALLFLLAQAVFIYRNDIVTNIPFVQPALNSVCAKLGCDISLSRHLERISIEASSLQQNAGQTQEGQPVEFLLRLTMRNRYDKNQPWPHLSLELKDGSGTTVVRKIIAPHQYLPSTLIDQPFAKGQEVSLQIPLTVNGLQINGFQLDKFFP